MRLNLKLDPTLSHNDEGAPRRAWRAAWEMLQNRMLRLRIVGDFQLRPIRKVQWKGAKRTAIKISGPKHNAVVLTIKPPKSGADQIWEYALICPDNRTIEIYDQLRSTEATHGQAAELAPVTPIKATASLPAGAMSAEELFDQLALPMPVAEVVEPQEEQKEMMPTTATEPATPKMDLLSKIQRLQQAADRVTQRKSAIERIGEERRSLQKQIEKLDQQELELLEAGERDVEAEEAVRTLQILENLFETGKAVN